MDAHIQVKNLNAYYGKNQSLKNINIEIPKKQITVIMGASGCGKTTLLKTFNRFLELTEGTRITGEVLVDGENIYNSEVDITEVRKVVGLLAQRPSPLPMSIYDNVVYGMHVHKMKRSRQEYKEAVRHYLEGATSAARRSAIPGSAYVPNHAGSGRCGLVMRSPHAPHTTASPSR